MNEPLFIMKIGATVYKDNKFRWAGTVRKGEGVGSYPFSRISFFSDYLEIKTPVVFQRPGWNIYKMEYKNIESFEYRSWIIGTQVHHNQSGVPKYVVLRGFLLGKSLHKTLTEKIQKFGLPIQFVK